MYNKLKMFTFSALVSAVFGAFGYALMDQSGFIAGLSLSAIGLTIVYWFSDKIILAVHHAEEVLSGDSYGVYGIVKRVANRAGMPIPRIFIIPDHASNAFAIGRTQYNASIVLTQGLLGLLSSDEMEAVIAHEMSHVKCGDTGLNGFTASCLLLMLYFVRPVSWAPIFGGISTKKRDSKKAFQWIVMALFAPVASFTVRFLIAEAREYQADSGGALLCGSSATLATALRKIQNGNQGLPIAGSRPATAHLYIVNPYSNTSITDLFVTHPPIDRRINRLLEAKI